MASTDREFMLAALAAARMDHGPLPDVDWDTPADLARLSLESFIQSRDGDAREESSAGLLHLSGPGVTEHSAALADVSALSGAWQRAVTAVAASIEGFYGLRGRVKEEIQRRSEIVMTAAPAAGSLVLHIGPKSDPMSEAEPDGQPTLLGERPRPLADEASERLISLLSALGAAKPGDAADTAAAEMRTLGPRVASAVRSLATAVEAANVTLEAEWAEPERPTVRAGWTSSEATWVKQFVDGRDLAAEDVVLTGKVVTVSGAQRWRVDQDDETYFLDASELSRDVMHSVNVDDVVEMRARMSVRVQADGTQKPKYTLRSVRVIEDDALL